MDDIDLEKLKQELDDVSGGSRYDVDDIMREAGMSESEQKPEELNRLMHKFGIYMDESGNVVEEPEGHAAPVTEDMLPDMPDISAMPNNEYTTELLRAAEQTQDLAQQQEELCGEEDEFDEPDALAEQDDVFAQLFAQLGDLEQQPVEDILQQQDAHTQTELLDGETNAIEESEDEPDLMARLFDRADASTAAPKAQTQDSAVPSEPAREQPPEPEYIPPEPEDDMPEDDMPEDDMPDDTAASEEYAEMDLPPETDEADDAQAEETPLPEQADEADAPKTHTWKTTKFWSEWFGKIQEKIRVKEPSQMQTEQVEKLREFLDEPDDMDVGYSLTDALREAMAQPDPIEPEATANHTPIEDVEIEEAPDDEVDGPEDMEFAVEEIDVPLPEPPISSDVVEADEDADEIEIPMHLYDDEEDERVDSVSAAFQEAMAQIDSIEMEERSEETDTDPAAEEQMVDDAIADDVPDSVPEAFQQAMEQMNSIETTEESPEPPRPDTEDEPVITEKELDEFLSEIKLDADVPSFEQLLGSDDAEAADSESESDEEEDPLEQLEHAQDAPEQGTTVYFEVPVRPTADDAPRRPQLFDVESEPEIPDEPTAVQTEAQPDVEIETEASKTEEPKANERFEMDWLGLPLEHLFALSPTLAQLRVEGPVMAREVARQKDRILKRRRLDGGEQKKHAPTPREEEQADTAEEQMTAIDAAGQLRELLRSRETVVQVDMPPSNEAAETAKPESVHVEAKQEMANTAEECEANPAAAPQEVPPDAFAPEVEDLPDSEEPEQASETKQPQRKQQRTAWPNEPVPTDVRKASKTWRIRARSKARRSIIVAVCMLIAVYISCASDFAILPLPSAMDYANHSAAVLITLIVLQLLAMIAAYDVVAEGVQALLHLCPNFSTLVDLALALNLVHCVTRLVWEGEEMPYTCVVILILFVQLRAKVLDCRTRHYIYKVMMSAQEPVGIFVDEKEHYVRKASMRDTESFLRQTVTPGYSRKVEGVITVLAAVVSVVLSAVIAMSTGDTGRLTYTLAATMTGACQIALLVSIAMGRCNAARRMMKAGGALDGLHAARKIAAAEYIVLTDNDLFPHGSVELAQMKLHGHLNDTTALAYAAALAGDSSLGHMLSEEVRTRYGAPLTAHHVVHDVSGGISGQIGGLPVLLGDAAFMKLHGITVKEPVPEDGLILAVDDVITAILVAEYRVLAPLANAMQLLQERHLKLLLHTRNAQVTPTMVETLYGLPKESITMLDMEQDRALRDVDYGDQHVPLGVLLRDGMVPLVDGVSTAKSQALLTTSGVILGLVAALIGMLLMSYLCYVFEPADARPIRILLYMILWFIPIFFIENETGKN